METTGAILLHDVEGDKFDTGTKFTLKKLIFGYAPQAKIKVLSGELLIGIKLENSPYNYILSRYSNVYLHVVGENHVAPLNGEEFSLLEAIGKPCDRLEAFNNKLEWGTELKEKARVRVAVRAPNLSVEERARAVLHYKGKIGNLPSTHFGVELMQEEHRRASIGTTDGTYQGVRYFSCEDGCGLFVSLHLISPVDGAVTQIKQDVACEYSVRRERTYAIREDSDAHSGQGSLQQERLFFMDESLSRRDERVMFYNKQGVKHYGVVQWTGKESASGKFDYPVVGIKTDKQIRHMRDFESSISGMGHLLKDTPIDRTLFLPKVLVEDCLHREGDSQVEGVQSENSELKTSHSEMSEQDKTIQHIDDERAKSSSPELLVVEPIYTDQNRVEKKRHSNFERGDRTRDSIQESWASEQVDKHRPSSLPANPRPIHITSQSSVDETFSLTEGSLIQIPAADTHNPMRYGVIRWIGKVPNVLGRVAGIELDDFMEGCTDGTYPHTNYKLKFFSCTCGKGVYYPLKKLLPDERYSDGNDSQVNKECQLVVKKFEDKLDFFRRDVADRSCHLQQQIEGLHEKLSLISEDIKVKEVEIVSRENEIQGKDEQIRDLQAKVDKESQLRKEIEAGDEDFIKIQSAGTLTAWNIPRSKIQSIAKTEIGRGAWGVVYSGIFRGERVAIKCAHRELLHSAHIDVLKREVMIMAHIQHPNLVRFIGAVFDDAVVCGTDTPIIVSELMDMNLREAYGKLNLSSFLITIFLDVAYALHYLHQHHQPIIHRDISAPNVLLRALQNGAYHAKVSDFGSANLVKQAKTAVAGAVIYGAPEMFPNEDVTVPPEPQTTKVDVFSYGILMLEVISKEMPTRETRYMMLQGVSHQWKVMYDLIVHCTKPLPSGRPTMADILNKLNRLPELH